jgi:hypothetical protein
MNFPDEGSQDRGKKTFYFEMQAIPQIIKAPVERLYLSNYLEYTFLSGLAF